eukprot:TRINITY_DN11650_c0_g1_i4.p1 TRINITY_DN11650_c0_g1~~TRINITY_DN11650_c0_g1_i4.p1  ORF type:complete len:321 (+),score=-62.75 TRINITY_DN11650_c0_g1_i4:258-1220(+)
MVCYAETRRRFFCKLICRILPNVLSWPGLSKRGACYRAVRKLSQAFLGYSSHLFSRLVRPLSTLASDWTHGVGCRGLRMAGASFATSFRELCCLAVSATNQRKKAYIRLRLFLAIPLQTLLLSRGESDIQPAVTSWVLLEGFEAFFISGVCQSAEGFAVHISPSHLGIGNALTPPHLPEEPESGPSHRGCCEERGHFFVQYRSKHNPNLAAKLHQNCNNHDATWLWGEVPIQGPPLLAAQATTRCSLPFPVMSQRSRKLRQTCRTLFRCVTPTACRGLCQLACKSKAPWCHSWSRDSRHDKKKRGEKKLEPETKRKKKKS